MPDDFNTKARTASVLILVIIVVFIALFSKGCATIKTFDLEKNSQMAAPYFIGTQYNAHKLMRDNGTLPAGLDIVPSFLADLLLLPGHIVLYYVNDRQDIAGPYKETEQ